MKSIYLILLVGMFLISFGSSVCQDVTLYDAVNQPFVVNDCTDLEVNIIDANIVQAEYIYTKSKVPNPTGSFFNLFDNSIFNKLTHFAYRIINGRGILDAEERWVGAEGYLACDHKCTLLGQSTNKFKDYVDCKTTC